ncbi:hypothetical protein D0S45_10375 [Marinifilum sp. JC120]|nr:hypothetical protein D0S45_10375 [Marinifilum sp. JC120]
MDFSKSKALSIRIWGIITCFQGKYLPAHPKPLQDELLSSWLVRIAEANAVKLHTMSRMLFGFNYSPWIRDIGRHGPDIVINKIAEVTGTPVSRVRETTLHGYVGWVLRHMRISGQTHWILPVKSKSADRIGYGVQYCPQCLMEDEKPYYRRAWRIAFYAFCPKHGTMLRDSCPECGASIVFHRRDFNRDIDQAREIYQCAKCEADLRDVPPEKPIIYDQRVYGLYSALLNDFHMGCRKKFNLSYFEVLHQLCKIIVSTSNKNQLHEYLCSKIGIVPKVFELSKGGSIEELRIDLRYYIVSLGLWLLVFPKRRLKSAWKAKAVRYNLFLRDFRHPPKWFADMVWEFNRLNTCRKCNK